MHDQTMIKYFILVQYGDTALHCGAKGGDINIIKALVKAKADVNLPATVSVHMITCKVYESTKSMSYISPKA